MVASGYNLTILVRIGRRLFENISKYLSLLFASGMIASFMAITGASPSMSRAGLVAGLSLVAWYYGRHFHPLFLLPFAMAITVLVEPSYAWGDLGWQLSFAAFAGVMVSAPLLQAYFFGDKKERALRRIMIETISAQLWTLPLLLWSFGSVSLVAPLANIMILPFIPLAMLLTFVGGLSGLVVPQLSVWIALPADAVLTYMTELALFFGNVPWATHQLQISLAEFALMYGCIISFTIYLWYRTRLQLANTSLIE